MNWQGLKAIYLHEMDRMRRTLFQSIFSPILSTSIYFVVFGSAIGSRIEEIDGVSGELDFNKIDIKNFSPKKRRDMSIAFVPENRLGHSAVPELTLSENILLSQFPKNKFSKNGILNHNFIDNHAKKVIDTFNVVTPGIDVKASSLSGGNLQ